MIKHVYAGDIYHGDIDPAHPSGQAMLRSLEAIGYKTVAETSDSLTMQRPATWKLLSETAQHMPNSGHPDRFGLQADGRRTAIEDKAGLYDKAEAAAREALSKSARLHRVPSLLSGGSMFRLMPEDAAVTSELATRLLADHTLKLQEVERSRDGRNAVYQCAGFGGAARPTAMAEMTSDPTVDRAGYSPASHRYDEQQAKETARKLGFL